MCQLLGLSVNREVHPGVYFSTLLSRSNLHPDGWGLGCYSGDSHSATIFKEPIRGSDSHLANFLCSYNKLKSKIFIGHIRKASRGSVEHGNTHPFNRCYYGREFIFAHNGTLKTKERLTGLTYQPIGTTDSERAFCYLLSQMRKYEIKPICADRAETYDAMQIQIIYEILQDINVIAGGSFNCLFSDGQYLFCYRDLSEARNLFYQKHNGSNINETSNFSENTNSYMENLQNIRGVIVATQPLNDGEWQSFSGGQLMVIRNGEVVADIS